MKQRKRNCCAAWGKSVPVDNAPLLRLASCILRETHERTVPLCSNCLSLGTSLTCAAKTFTAIDYLGLSGFGENLAMGATISIAGGIVGKNPFTHSNQKVQENFVEVEVFP